MAATGAPALGPAVEVIQGDCLEVLPGLPAASFDAVVTDPPYFLQFRGDRWDVAPWEGSAAVWPLARFGFTDKSRRAPGAVLGSSRNPVCRRCHKHLRGQDHCTCEQPDSDEADHRLADLLRFAAWCEAWAAECLRLLKPGGYLVAFGAPRTHHWLAVGVEAAGFEVRDCIAWLKFGGMPKSTDLGKLIDQRAGAQRRVIALRRKHDVRGGAYLKRPGHAHRNLLYAVTEAATDEARRWTGWGTGTLKPVWEPALVARKPLEGNLLDNVARHGTGALHVDACRVPWAAGEERAYFGGRNLTKRPGGYVYGSFDPDRHTERHPLGRFPGNAVTVDPDAFWAPYTLVAPPEVCRKIGRDRDPDNFHPTIKPVPLMRWLCRLVTPPGGCILDPFAGSGSTGVACVVEGFGATLIEREPQYADIARRRVAAAQGAPRETRSGGRVVRQISLFGEATEK